MLKRLIATAGLMVTMGVAFISSPAPAYAQGAPAWCDGTTMWQYTWSFTSGSTPHGNWRISQAVYTAGVGYQTSYQTSGGFGYRTAHIEFVAPVATPFTLTSYEVTLINVSQPFAAPAPTQYLSHKGSTSYPFSVLASRTLPNGNSTYSWAGNVPNVSYLVSLNAVGRRTSNADPGGNATITGVQIRGAGGNPSAQLSGGTLIECATFADDITHPLASADRVGSFQSAIDDVLPGVAKSNNNAVAFVSEKNNANVSAVSDGVVVSIRGISLFQCLELMTQPPGCDYPVYQGAINPLMPPLPIISLPYTVSNAYIVEIQDGSDTYLQLVADAPEFVVEGMNVTPGCWIGRVLSMPSANWATISGYLELYHPFVDENQPSETISGLTVTWTKEAGAYTDRWDDYVLEPSLSAPCNRPAGYEGCLGDFELSSSASWGYTASVGWENPGALLRPGDRIWTNPPLNLVQSREPEVIVRGLSFPGTNQSIRVRLGNTVQDFVLSGANTNSGDGVRILASASHTPNVGSLYTVEVTNTGTANIRLYYICPRHTKTTGGTPEPPPTELPPETIPPGEIPPPGNISTNACRFSNADFASGSTGWSLSAGSDVGAGEVYIPGGGTASQTLTLPAGTYPLNLILGLWTYNGFSDATNTDTLTAEWAFPATSYNPIATRTFGAFASSGAGVVTLSTNVTIASQTTGAFTIRITLNNPPAGVRGVAIKAVCLGNSILTTGEESGGLFTPSCTPIATPTVGAPLGSWISWLWARLNAFFNCDLMLVLNEMYNTIYDGYLLAGWSMRWVHATTQLYTDWLVNDFAGWLGGHLSNIASGQRVTVVQAGGCDNIFCAITGLFDGLRDVFSSLVTELASVVNKILDFLIDMLTAVINVLFNLIAGVISLIIWIVNEVLRLFRLAQEVLFALVGAWSNATPQPISGLDCASNWEQNGLCLAFWVMDNTVFSGNGEYLIPTLISLSAILLMLWGVKRIRATIMQIGSVA